MPEDIPPEEKQGSIAGSGTDLNPSTETVSSEEKEEKAISFSWGVVMVRTKRLLGVLDTLAKYRIFADLGWVFLLITLVSGAIMIWLMLDQVYLLLTGSLAFRCFVGAAPAAQCEAAKLISNPQTPIQSLLLLPGINPLIPVVYGLIGIIVAVVVHEGTHGVIARSVKLPVKSTGLIFLLFVPFGAFVEVDEKLIQKARFRDSGRILAGGPGSNVIVALAALALLLVIMGGLVPVPIHGVYIGAVDQYSPAGTLYNQHYLHPGDSIIAVNGTQIQSVQNLSSYLANTRPNESLTLSILHQGQVNNYTITLAKYPGNKSIGYIGITQTISQDNLVSTRNTYSSSFFSRPILYLVVPGILPQADQVAPFSNVLNGLYSSPSLGAAWYPISLTLFWIWFINVNLAFFNAIPLYPLDGGQAMLNFFTHFGRKWVETRAKLLTTIISLVMFALILAYLVLPRVLALIPF